MFHLLPKYKPKLKMSKPVKKSVAVWDDDTIDSLKGEFRCTDWDVFINNCTDMSELCDTVSSYVNFCEQCVVKCKDEVCYPNTKPWITKYSPVQNKPAPRFCL